MSDKGEERIKKFTTSKLFPLIVAREYGIPAVLAAGDATKRLSDGDMVLVDATYGTVALLV